MKNIFKTIFGKPKIVISVVAVIAALAGVITYGYVGKKPTYDYTNATRGSISDNVSVPGTVTPAESVDLAFPRSGKIASVKVKAGDEVTAGEVIAGLDAQDAALDIQNAEIAYNDLVHVDPLDVTKAKTQIDLAESSLTTNYSTARLTLLTASKDLPDIVSGLEEFFDGQGYLSSSKPNLSDKSKGYRETAEDSYHRADASVKDFLKEYNSVTDKTSDDDIEKILDDANDTANIVSQATKDSKDAITYIRDRDDNPTDGADQAYASVSSLAVTSNSSVASLLSAKEGIDNTKRNIDELKKTLADVQNGPDTTDIQASQVAIQQKQKAYSDYFITSPINGIVTKADIHPGEIAIGDTPAISLISKGAFQIETYVSQADIGKVSVGQDASIVFDAYGPDTPFDAKVVSVDPAETMTNGQASYKVVLQFNDEDPRIKSGLSAKATILGTHKDNVILVPRTAIVTKDLKSYVLVKSGDTVVQKEVEVGIENDTEAEILSGINEGDQIVTFGN